MNDNTRNTRNTDSAVTGHTDNLLFSLRYGLRWLAWAFHHLVILPAAMLLLMLILMFRLDNSTPGRMMAAEITSVTQNVSTGQFRIPGCEGVKALRANNVCHQTSVTDAAGYAAHIDHSMSGSLKTLWVVLALVFAGLSFAAGTFPGYWREGRARSVMFTCVRYGTRAETPDKPHLHQK